MHRLTVILGISIVTLLASCTKQPDWSPAPGDIMTRWAEYVNHDKVLPEYPRPQMVRKEWRNLNGLWNYAIRPKEESKPDIFDQKILVPYPIESALSGIKKPVGGENKLWYQRSFEIPDGWKGQRIILHLGAVDWETTVWINNREVGKHRGGYDGFGFDITDFLDQSGSQEIVLAVWDPVDSGFQPRGKQVKKPRGIWYTSVTGIWQTVWLEPVPIMHIEYLKIIPDVDESCVRITAFCTEMNPGYSVLVRIKDDNQVQAEVEGVPGEEIVANIENPALWSPDSPFLYNLEVSLINDQEKQIDFVSSYFGMRKIALGKDEQGITRIFLNNEPIFMHGPLDQGWWPDGLYTAPTDEALRYDIEMTKKLGFNMIRKHVKIEPERWYYWCDKLGLVVWQDMPSGDESIGPEDPDILRSKESAVQFKKELRCMIDGLYNHPSIIMWVLFNEGWGQFETEKITQWIKEYDPTRLVNSASGWSDRGCGDVHDIHSYPGPASPPNEGDRAAVLGEYGGLGLPLLGHTWRKEENWGYRGFENAEDLTFAYQELTRKLWPLFKNGLCAAVYTQLTDVEIEVNGLMTYDRAVIKMDPERVRLINRGYLAPGL
jgi:beta-galactosidase/beta-glucuronidase